MSRSLAKTFSAFVARGSCDDNCPGCSERVTWQVSSDGTSVELLHPQPPCDGFREFVDKLKRASRERWS
jgi:organic radical activating enzyme